MDSEILFVDDDRAILELVREYLLEFGYRVDAVDNGFTALELIKDKPYEIVFTDIKMPDIDGLSLLSAIKEYRPDTEVIIVTGHGTMESAIQAMKHGSYDYLQKPFKLQVLKIIIDRILDEKKLKKEKIVLKTRVKDRHRYDVLVGISLAMQEIYETLEHIRQNRPDVLVQGESGTGKALVAQVICRRAGGGEEPLLSVNCKSLLKGVAPPHHAERLRDTLDSAPEGTIFMDELCELPLSAQAALAALIQAHGGAAGARLPAARIVAATNRDVKEAVKKGVLDPKLVEALGGVRIEMPALRDRKEDICLLINHFLQQFNEKSAKKVLSVSPEAMDYLLGYNWPGNVIQLENVIERAFALGVDLVIQIDDLPAEIRTAGEISRLA
jgi:DNA-binding NtrC family response regulator